ncbi:MAG: LexA family transcriptional regulator [Phycisphaerae bacterium]|nr:LexA family transcriptional regulator [Phycisphaerae bacterium]
MQTVGAIIRAQRLYLGLTLQQLADATGCTKGYLSSIENNRRDHPPSEALLEKIERALKMDVGRLVSVGKWHVTPETVRRRVLDLETERHHARRLAKLLMREGLDKLHRSGELQQLVERLEGDGVSPRSARTEPSPDGSIGWRSMLPLQVPLINKVAAGYPTEFTDLGYPARIADEYVSVPELSDPDAFAARVVGRSMEPQYHEGDIVVFSPLAPTKNGSDCFVRFERNEESTFKRVYIEEEGQSGIGGPGSGKERLRLQALNPAFASRVVEREEIAGMYAAVYVVRAVPPAGQ